MGHGSEDDPRDAARELDLDTSRIDPALRTSEWQRGLAQLFGALEVEFSDEPHTDGRLQSLRLGECTVVSIESNAHRARRTPSSHTSNDPPNDTGPIEVRSRCACALTVAR